MARVVKAFSYYQVISELRLSFQKRAKSSLIKMWRQVRKSYALWRARHKQRAALSQLSAYQLKDIGLSRSDALNEVSKPFWKE
jgi:uncharacterized protein YjiS (DUF1127 family)